MSFIPTTLYYASAAINAVSIPGHILFGIKEVDPAIASIPHNEEHALGKATATTAWDMVNDLLAASALLNIQWSRVRSSNFERESHHLDHRLGGHFDRLENSDSVHRESQICGAWVDVLPQLPCLASDASVLSEATLALAILINSQRSLSRTCDVESPQSYYDAIHKMRGHIATNGLSLELLPAIMCLSLVELMLPDSVSALNMHLHAIRILFQNYGPGTFSSGLFHQLFLGFRPFIIAEALHDRQPTFLATSTWINIPFSINAVTPTQEFYSEIAAIPSILQEIDILSCVSSTENGPASRVLIGSLFEASKRLCAWENALDLNIIPSVTSFSDLQPTSINIPQRSPKHIWFPNIPIANGNGMTHCWSIQVICLLEIDKILSRLLNCTGILEGLSEEINPISVRAEGDRLAFLICSSMDYLFQNEMKLFGPALALFPTQIAYAWFERHRACNDNGIEFIKGVVAQLVQRGLLSAPRLVLDESSI